MNLLDRVIGWVAPETGAKRTRARLQMETAGGILRRSYDAAKQSRRTDGWVVGGGSANAEIAPALGLLRWRSRELVRNNPYAARAVDILAANIVGSGITARPKTGNQSLDKRVSALWDRWAGTPECDADGQLDFYGLQTLIARTVEESGECLVRFRTRRPEDGLSIPLQLQVLEPDYLDTTKDTTAGTPDNPLNTIEQGIEYDALGNRVAYYLYRRHPGDVSRLATLQSTRVPADEVLHVYRKARPGQQRGVPRLSPVALKLRDLDDYHEAALVKAKVEACFSGFVTRPDAEITPLAPATTDANGDRVESLEPGMVNYLGPGETIEFANPSGAGAYEPFTLHTLMAIAAGIGITYDQLTGDLRQANYSSLRAGKIEFRRLVEQAQWLMMIPMLCAPVWRKAMDMATLSGAMPARAGGYPAEWSPPGHEPIDPVKDLAADVSAVRAGVLTLKQAIARRGYDPSAQIAEIAATNAELDSLGVVLNSDPRKTAASGATQATGPAPTSTGDQPNA